MIRRPPRSTLFPTRRSSDLVWTAKQLQTKGIATEHYPGMQQDDLGIWHSPRSEEHTSELQSRLHLVCRLLLEKKKNESQSPIPVSRNAAMVYSMVVSGCSI